MVSVPKTFPGPAKDYTRPNGSLRRESDRGKQVGRTFVVTRRVEHGSVRAAGDPEAEIAQANGMGMHGATGDLNVAAMSRQKRPSTDADDSIASDSASGSVTRNAGVAPQVTILEPL